MTSDGPFRLAVCEAPVGMTPDDDRWRELAAEARGKEADVFLLNEMPFGPWVSAASEPDFDQFVSSERLHARAADHYRDLGASVVLGSQPAFEMGASVNEGFAWDADNGITAVHTKQFFPNEPGWYEEQWFERGNRKFEILDIGGLNVGFLICTDIMFNEWARLYGRQGCDLIVVPRATPVPTLRRWQTAVQMAAVVSGCYVASSNRSGEEAGVVFGGLGWIVDPSGVVIAETSADEPVVAADIYRSVAAHAKREYPCYVDDTPPPFDEADDEDDVLVDADQG